MVLRQFFTPSSQPYADWQVWLIVATGTMGYLLWIWVLFTGWSLRQSITDGEADLRKERAADPVGQSPRIPVLVAEIASARAEYRRLRGSLGDDTIRTRVQQKGSG